MTFVLNKFSRILLIGIPLVLILWIGTSYNAAPRAIQYFATIQKPGEAIDLDSKSHMSESPEDLRTSSTVTSTYSTATSTITPASKTTSSELTWSFWSQSESGPAAERVGTFIDGQNITDAEILEYLESILDMDSQTLPRLECPGERTPHPRYEILQEAEIPGIQYLFAINLYQSIAILNRLMASIIQAIRFLGPEKCAISIIEGRSTDGTFVVLDHLRLYLEDLNVKFWLSQSDISPLDEEHDRIEQLATLRNQAIGPLLTEHNKFVTQPQIIFFNDITLCPDDILELIYQHKLQNAIQTCAMDWVEKGENFYDVWVSRTMTGNIFWEIPQSGEWTFVQNLFYDDPFTKKKFQDGQPFQVFSCWGGMTAIEATPFMHEDLRFRRNVKGECYGGEPQLLGMDLAKLGMSKVQAIPSVNVGYGSNQMGLQVKKLRGYVHEKVDLTKSLSHFEDDVKTERVHWKPSPHKIRCMPNLGDTFWVDPWYDPSKKEDD